MAYKPPMHGRDHCPGGSDPIPCLGNAYCYMDWNGPETITVNTLTNPAATAADYEEGFIAENDGAGFSLDLANGTIEWDSKGEYLVTAWVQFNGGATVGSKLEGVLDFGNNVTFSTFRVGNHIIADAINEVFRIPIQAPVYSFNPGVFGHNSVRVLVDHDDAGGQDLNSVRLHVMRISPIVAGEFLP